MNTGIAQALQKGDRIKLILDKETGPDTHLHGRIGEIIDIDFDDAGWATVNSEDNFMYQIKLDNGEVPELHFRRHNLKKIED